MPENVDFAIQSRIGTQLPVWLPSASERRERLVHTFEKAVRENIADKNILNAKFIDEMTKITHYRAHRTITSALKYAWNVPLRKKIHEAVAQNKLLTHVIDPTELDSVTQDQIRTALKNSTSAEKDCEKLIEWALANKVPFNKFVPPEYRASKGM